jgi:hypothetical protein
LAILHYGDSREADIRLSSEQKMIEIDFEKMTAKTHKKEECRKEYHFPVNNANAYRVVEKCGKVHL